MIRKDAERGGESGFAIYVNGSHPRVRRRFSIAHEIAHFALHRNLIGDGVTDDAMYRSNLSRSEEHTSEIQSLMRISYAVFCLKKKTQSLHVSSRQSSARY